MSCKIYNPSWSLYNKPSGVKKKKIFPPNYEIVCFERHQDYTLQYTHRLMQTILQRYVWSCTVQESPNQAAFVGYLGQVIFCLTIVVLGIISTICTTTQCSQVEEIGGFLLYFKQYLIGSKIHLLNS